MAAPLADVSPERTRVAVVGLGHMGEAIAERILAAGYPLGVFNRSPGRDERLVAAGATRLGSAASALAECDVCVTSLSDDAPSPERSAASAASSPARAPGPPSSRRARSRCRRRPGSPTTRPPPASRTCAPRSAATRPRSAAAPPPSSSRGRPPRRPRSGRCSRRSSRPCATPATDEQARVLKLVLQVMIGGTAGLLAEAITLGEAAGV